MFQGQSCHTHYWPKEPVRFAGKRVAVIGTGATGVQTITEVAKTVGHLIVFQRPPMGRAIAQCQDQPGGDGPDPGPLSRNLRALPADLRLLHPCDRPAQHPRGEGLLFTEVDSWMTGINRNVEGKQVRRIMRYSGGHPAFRERCEAAADGYRELALA
jgi:hypothetical protein